MAPGVSGGISGIAAYSAILACAKKRGTVEAREVWTHNLESVKAVTKVDNTVQILPQKPRA